MPDLPPGIILVDKPVGISSFAAVRYIRTRLGERKVGHAGTLDPLASGLLIMGAGPATKRLHDYIKLPKTYEAEICLGEQTTTGDREGEVLARAHTGDCKEDDVQVALAGMVGILELPVPAYSAIKQGGEPLYKKARRGEQVEVPIKPMEVRDAVLLGVKKEGDYTYARVRFDVASGTYIRSLAEELGRRLGYPARLENLRRTQVGEWRVEDAETITP